MLLQKWNFKTHEYEPFGSPAKVLALYSEDMVAEVDCANCGERVKYGDTYTSRTIHNHIGLGYPVCDNCYSQERDDEHASKQ